MATKIVAAKFPRLVDEKELRGMTVDEALAEYNGTRVTEKVGEGAKARDVDYFVFETELNALCFGMRWS